PFCASYCFSLFTSRDHRDFHSFPTRRSSDLYLCKPACLAARSRKDRASRFGGRSCGALRWTIFPVQFRPFSTLGRRASQSVEKRSEEHTSELQSLAYLVCRLLLEKKNKLKDK